MPTPETYGFEQWLGEDRVDATIQHTKQEIAWLHNEIMSDHTDPYGKFWFISCDPTHHEPKYIG